MVSAVKSSEWNSTGRAAPAQRTLTRQQDFNVAMSSQTRRFSKTSATISRGRLGSGILDDSNALVVAAVLEFVRTWTCTLAKVIEVYC